MYRSKVSTLTRIEKQIKQIKVQLNNGHNVDIIKFLSTLASQCSSDKSPIESPNTSPSQSQNTSPGGSPNRPSNGSPRGYDNKYNEPRFKPYDDPECSKHTCFMCDSKFKCKPCFDRCGGFTIDVLDKQYILCTVCKGKHSQGNTKIEKTLRARSSILLKVQTQLLDNAV
jgi:hypothetical protein